MNEKPLKDEQIRLIEDYFDSRLSEADFESLEALLLNNDDARTYFMQVSQLQAELTIRGRAQISTVESLKRFEQKGQKRYKVWAAIATLATTILLALILSNQFTRSQPVAWLTNAQNCVWNGEKPIVHRMNTGTVLELKSGLAEFQFASGANVILEGPAKLEIQSPMKAFLEFGKLTARVPDGLSGFEINSPQGKVVDLGTEFGVRVGETTEVKVFDGSVDLSRKGETKTHRLLEDGQAEIDDRLITIGEPNNTTRTQFTREIQIPKVKTPKTITWEFDQEYNSGLPDRNGSRVGLDRRMPGTGNEYSQNDPNLELDIENGVLNLLTTRSDINRQVNLPIGEYFGISLSEFGFTGKEDFRAETTIKNIPAMEGFGQFGLFIGSQSDKNIRGGFIKWGQRGKPNENTAFLVNNNGGNDSDGFKIGLLSEGDDLKLSLARICGVYSLTVDNLTKQASTTLKIRQPNFLDDENELMVGLFGANPFNDATKLIQVENFAVTVWRETDPADFTVETNTN